MIIGIGVDVVEISRLRRVIERQGDRFVHRVFTEAEREYCGAHRDPAPNYAVRFAAKEAVFKAIGTGWAKGVTWLDVEVCRKTQEAPFLVLHGEAQRVSLSLGVQSMHLSLSHSEGVAVAMVVFEK
jgi:holo-[acyl-carrier protein] synthase